MNTRTARSLALGVAAVALFAIVAPAEAQSSNSIRFRAGLFTPDADSDYWDDNFAVFTGDEGDFEEVSAGIDFRKGLGPRGGFLFSLDLYSSDVDQAYLDFIDSDGFDIIHTTSLDVSAFTVGYTYDFADSRQTGFVPYAGVGGGVYVWELQETGDFIDFAPLDPELFNATFSDDGEAFGWYWLAGVKFNLGPRWDFFVEGRWATVEDELSGDFDGLGDIDLGGRTIHGGIGWKF